MSRLITILNALALLILLAMPAAVHAQDATDAGAPDAASPYGVAHTVTLSTGTLTYIEVAPDQSPRAVLQQMEEDDIENGTADSRTTPYILVSRDTGKWYRNFLPLAPITGYANAASENSADNLERFQPIGTLAGDTRLAPEQLLSAKASADDAAAYVHELTEALATATEVGAADADGAQATSYTARASIGGLVAYTEPNDAYHVNYCGPSTMRVALDAVMSQSELPTIWDIAHGLIFDKEYACGPGGAAGFNPAWGTYGCAMCNWLHRYLLHKAGIYRYEPYESSSPNKNILWDEVIRHVGKNYAVPTGTQTEYLYGWGGHKASHINALIGYEYTYVSGGYFTVTRIRYAETASRTAGYLAGQFKIWYSANDMWTAIRVNNVQCRLKAGI